MSTCGITRGMLVTDRRPSGPATDWPAIEVPWDIDAELFLNRFEEVMGARGPRCRSPREAKLMWESRKVGVVRRTGAFMADQS